MKNKLSIIVSSILLTSTICAKDINIINGWQIKGSDSGFSNMNSFNKNCIDTVWAYDTASNSWQAYSPKNATQNLINNSSIVSLSNLKEGDGFWVKGNSDCIVENNSTNANTTIQDDNNLTTKILLSPSQTDGQSSVSILLNSTNDNQVLNLNFKNGDIESGVIESASFFSEFTNTQIKLEFNENGTPTKLIDENENQFIITNITETTFDITAYDKDNTKLSDTKTINNSNLARTLNKKVLSRSLAKNIITDIASNLTIGEYISITSEVISAVSCGASAFTAVASGGLATPIAIAACGSYGLNAISQWTDSATAEASNFTVGFINTVTDTGGCMSGNLAKCGTMALSTAAYAGDLQTTLEGKTILDFSYADIKETSYVAPTANLTNGLVAHYEFEGNANDSSGNGNHGTDYANSSNYDTGLIGQSKEFSNGYSYTSPSSENDYMEIPMILNPSNFTISLFVKPYNVYDNGGAESLISYGRDSVNGEEFFSIFLNTDLKVSLSIFNKNKEHVSTLSHTVNTKIFHHIIATYTPENIKLYIDGNLIDTVDSLSLDLDQYSELMIASHKWSYEQHSTRFSGKLDDLRIYNRILSETEIQELYNLGQ